MPGASKALELKMAQGAFVFSLAPDASEPMKPDTVSQRYERMCAALSWDMNIHELRHYSATELISAGVDVQTVAGRLGHGGGGATTLRVYAAWVSESDQKAATALATRLPLGHDPFDSKPRVLDSGSSPYQRVADELLKQIRTGKLATDDYMPTLKEISSQFNISAGTAHRALNPLVNDGWVTASRGQRATVNSFPRKAMHGLEGK